MAEPPPTTDDDAPGGDARLAARRQRDGALVRAVRDGDERAFGTLYDVWFDPVHDLARRIVGDPDVAAEVAQDAFLSAWRRLDTLVDPDAFGGWLLRIVRNAAYNRSARERRSRPADDQELAVIEQVGAGAPNAPDGFRVEDRLARAASPHVAVEDAEVVALVWEAADALGERDRDVLDLQLRHGLSPAEIADVLGTNRNAANQLVHRIRGRMERAVRARVLWRSGSPECAELRSALQAAGVSRFGADAVRVISTHVERCERCAERQRLLVAPTALFSAVPVVAAPFALKQQVAAALAEAGVPVEGAAALTGAGGDPSGGPDAGGPGSAAPPAPPAGPASFVGAAVEAPHGRDTATTTTTENGQRRSRQAVLVGALVVLVLLAAGVVALVLGQGDATDAVEAAAGGPTSTPATTAAVPRSGTAPSGTLPPVAELSDPAPTSPADGPPATTTIPDVVAPATTGPASPVPGVTVTLVAPDTVPPPPAPPTSAPPATTAPPVTDPPLAVQFAITPPSKTASSVGWSPAELPVLSWAVTGGPAGTTVEVTGRNDLADTTWTGPSGSERVCPGALAGAVCVSVPPGSSWDYALVVRAPGGEALWNETVTLTVTP